MRILVVEDEQKIAAIIKRGLEQEAYAVDTASDGRQGFDMASATEYDVLVLDLMLPEIDGLDVCRLLRKNGIQTPVLILTAKSQLDDKVTGFDAGADDYLTKPFAFAELVARIRALIRRPRNNLGTVLAIEDLHLNTLTREVTRDGKKISLSRTEFALLEYLLINKEIVLTKDQLIDHVWDYDADILPNTVEVYVSYLRSKVDKPFSSSPPLIHTIRGFGYKVGRLK